MTRLLFTLAASGALLLAPAEAQTLRDSIKLMLARDSQRASETAGSEPSAGGTAESADLPAGQLSASLRQFLADGETGATPERVRSEQHRRAMQVCLELASVETRVLGLVGVYLESLRVERRLEDERNLAGLYRKWKSVVAERGSGKAEDLTLLDQRLGEAEDALRSQEFTQQRAYERFQRLVGQSPAGLEPPAVPSIPADRGDVDLSRNWNYLAATEAVRAAEWARSGARGRLTEILGGMAPAAALRESSPAPGAQPVGSQPATERKGAWQLLKATELQQAADLQRRYSLSVLWRERQADLAAVNSLRIQVAIRASEARNCEIDFLAGRRSASELLSLYESLSEFRARLIDGEHSLTNGAFRILGLQGRCLKFVMGDESGSPGLPAEPSGRDRVLRAMAPAPAAADLASNAGWAALAGVPAWIDVFSDQVSSGKPSPVE